jgi:ATP-dependent DNA helicase 2 subunit 2
MGAIIENQIWNSLGEPNYDRVVEELGVMKDKLMACEEPSLYILHTTTFAASKEDNTTN